MGATMLGCRNRANARLVLVGAAVALAALVFAGCRLEPSSGTAGDSALTLRLAADGVVDGAELRLWVLPANVMEARLSQAGLGRIPRLNSDDYSGELSSRRAAHLGLNFDASGGDAGSREVVLNPGSYHVKVLYDPTGGDELSTYLDATFLDWNDIGHFESGRYGTPLRLEPGRTATFEARLQDASTYYEQPGWVWISGSSTIDEPGVYGTQGSPAPDNVPGARWGAVSWVDDAGDLWLFGGDGNDGAGASGNLNDLWRFDGANWTWMSGSSTIEAPGVYGDQGIAAPGNVPGARYNAASWIDGAGNLWLFGGIGVDGLHNDLWRFDGDLWTWVSGSEATDQMGDYGEQGIPSPEQVPGARYNAVSWIDGAGDLWLFGGISDGTMNDLWRFDGDYWTWISGDSESAQPGEYGTQGIAGAENVPGARHSAVSWIDDAGALWLFGGDGFDVNGGTIRRLNDLWRFDGVNWTWISGSEEGGQSGMYGTQGSPASQNVPGGRWGAASWVGREGNLWLFGGTGRDEGGTEGRLNDLWRFDGANWTWISGSSNRNQGGDYGNQGLVGGGNQPGARNRTVTWIDRGGNLWLFGGRGYDADGDNLGFLNDLWRFQP